MIKALIYVILTILDIIKWVLIITTSIILAQILGPLLIVKILF